MNDKIEINHELYNQLMESIAHVPGDFCEIGVWRGQTFRYIYQQALDQYRKVHAVDSFIGMPAPVFETDKEYRRGLFSTNGSAEFRGQFPEAIIHEGFVPEILDDINVDSFAFLHLDIDHEYSTRLALDWIWPRMSSGGILICHDWFPEAKKLAARAVKNWLNENLIYYKGAQSNSIWFRKNDRELSEIEDPRSIFKHFDDFPKRDIIQIVAPGFHASKELERLNPDYPTIVVNKAIEMDIKKDIWLVGDYNQSLICQWFSENIDRYADIACLLRGTLANSHPHIKYTFDHGPKLESYWPIPRERMLRYGATVGGQALQLAYHMGAKVIILCGLDFKGDRYYDDSLRVVKPQYRGWRIKKAMNSLVDSIRHQGVEIVSLSDTALGVENI